MPLEILDVIDTAVKVGLGAAISGIATYQVTRLNHSSDISKELAKRKVEALTYSIEKLELYFAAFSRCYARLTGFLQAGTEPGNFPVEKLKLYKEVDQELVKARDARAVASSRLRLVGQSEAARLIAKISAVERKLRDKVIFDKKIPSLDELNEISKEINEIKKTIYELLAKAFENAHGVNG